MNKIRLFLSLALTLVAGTVAADGKDNIQTRDLAKMFSQPPMEYRPYVWWHWMGSNFSKEGIRKDLEAMKEAGIAGATIFNITSAVQESHYPIEGNPWPEQTYRSPAYWDALVFAAQEAERLGMKIGLHNSPGYSTTGGPWITEEMCMQKIVKTRTDVDGGGRVDILLPQPEYPVFTDYSGRKRQATFYKDVAVVAVKIKDNGNENDNANDNENANADGNSTLYTLNSTLKDVSSLMDSDGRLTWDAPEGRWAIYRFGHAPTMSTPHPLPDDLIGKTLEADKMSLSVTNYHWDQVLGPLTEHLKPYIGRSFTHLLIDSYEAGQQDWTDGFREKFMEMHGYDPLIAIAENDVSNDAKKIGKTKKDMEETISRLFIDNGWKPALKKIHDAGLQMFWEPYWGPFNTSECVAIPDLPMSEYWTGGSGRIPGYIVDPAKAAGKNIVGAEAFTGRPEVSKYTEDPAFLKHSADGAFVSGANLLFLHHWVHQPFPDRYQPGMGMGWWGTHFSRFQTWFEPGKAFFTYLSRCQMMLRQGTLEERTDTYLHRRTTNADIYFVVNQKDSPATTELRPASTRLSSPITSSSVELWDPYTGKISYAEQNAGIGVGTDGTVTVTLQPGKSAFIVINHGKAKYKKSAAYIVKSETSRKVEGPWELTLSPKLDESFSIPAFTLTDFSLSPDERLKYFSGTATYTKRVVVDKNELGKGRRVIIRFGTLNDIAELSVNGKKVGVLWYPPYDADITDFLHRGENTITIAVTNNWANRMIGDEQWEPDFEWGYDRGVERGRGLKALPEWFMKPGDRPQKNRKTFVIWNYFRKDSPLQPAGLVGPVEIVSARTE